MLKSKWETDTTLPTLQSSPRKVTLTEWHLDNHIRYKRSQIQQKLAERLLAESERIRDEAAEIVNLNKQETDHRLEEKLENIEFCKQELLRVREEIVEELDSLSIYKTRVSGALASVNRNALMISEKCLCIRGQRLGIDLVQDEVEIELHKECNVIKNVQNLLEQTLEETQEKIRRLKATLYFMDQDLHNKDDNLRIDKCNLHLRESNLDSKTLSTISVLDPSNISLKEWETQTNKKVIEASKELKSAKLKRCYIDTVLKRTTDDLNSQKSRTNNAFKCRIDEIKEVKEKLEVQHAEIMRQVNDMTQNISRLEKSIAEKEKYIALAHVRLANRSQRPDSELTRDLVETNLVKEICDFRKVVSNLQQILHEAQTSLRRLLKTKVQLEESIQIKMNTLKIDEVECMTLRESMHFNAY